MMSTVEVQQRKFKMLKDFLSENPNSCSSNGFKSLPRKPNDTNNNNKRRNQNSPFQKLINTITTISFFTYKLSSSSSSRSRKRRNQSCSVKIKDIIRWKSFRDIVEQQPPLSSPPPLDFNCNMVGSITTATTTTCASSSSCSSWCDSDFTSGYLSSWEPQNDNVLVGKELVAPAVAVAEYTAEVGFKEDLTCQEYEQHSPVSVLEVGEDEFLSFDQNLVNIQRRKQKFQNENSNYDEEVKEQNLVKERARKVLHNIKATESMQSCENYYLDKLLLDFFMEELSARRDQIGNDEEFECEILRKAKEWLNGSFAYDIEHVNKDTYIKDMDKKSRWSIFEEGKQELALEIETTILHNLVSDLLNL